jgi:hypothetical protein
MRRIENKRVGGDDFAPQDFAAIEVGEIQLESFEREWRLGDQPGNQLASRNAAVRVLG